MFGIDTTIIVAAFAAMIAFIVTFLKRGEKIRKMEDDQKAQGELDEIIEDIRGSVPSSFHIDRELHKLSQQNANPGTDSTDSGEGSLR